MTFRHTLGQTQQEIVDALPGAASSIRSCLTAIALPSVVVMKYTSAPLNPVSVSQVHRAPKCMSGDRSRLLATSPEERSRILRRVLSKAKNGADGNANKPLRHTCPACKLDINA
jgi:hypothetical protein